MHTTPVESGCTPISLAKVVVLVEGNEVGGSFYLNDTDAIPADASAEDMENLLEATSLGDVNVTRYGPQRVKGSFSLLVHKPTHYCE